MDRQAAAEMWAETRVELERANEKERLAVDEARRMRQRLQTISEDLSRSVGDNISERVFRLKSGDVVIVEHKRGVRLVTPEPA